MIRQHIGNKMSLNNKLGLLCFLMALVVLVSSVPIADPKASPEANPDPHRGIRRFGFYG